MTTLHRHAIREAALLQLLNWELGAYEERDGCRFTAIEAFPLEDDSGCNWRDARLEAEAPLAVAGQVIAHEVLEQTRRSFNLLPA